VHVHDLALVRSGDKGDISNVVVLAKDADAYEHLCQGLHAEAVKQYMGELVTGRVAVYRLPKLHALQVVMHGALGGGATRTLRFDETGKSMCAILSRMELHLDPADPPPPPV
jgi:hypothetical protein